MNTNFTLKNYDLLIFDWDGTIIDSIDWIVHCLQQAAIDCGCQPSERQAAKNVIGLSIVMAMRTLFPEVDDTTLNALTSRYSHINIGRELTREHLFAGVYDFLSARKADGYLLAVATGKTRKGLNQVLQTTMTEDLFVVTRGADETASKPNPKMLEEILTHTGISKERVLLIGDSVHDIQMANNAGIAAVAVCCGANAAEELQALSPLLLLQQVTDLQSFLE
ncbi:MAG: HAD-IA family hydrolase [Methylococcaceae bacterium]